MQSNLELDIVSGSGVGHGTPDFDALSERSNHRRESQSTVAGPPSCASVALRMRLRGTLKTSPVRGGDYGGLSVADPECARGGGVSHILA